MKHAPVPWNLVSSELDQHFMICDATGLPVSIPTTRMSQTNHPAWRDKKISAKDLWQKIATEQEQASANLIAAAPELLEALVEIEAYTTGFFLLYKAGDEFNEWVIKARSAINKAKGKQ